MKFVFFIHLAMAETQAQKAASINPPRGRLNVNIFELSSLIDFCVYDDN